MSATSYRDYKRRMLLRSRRSLQSWLRWNFWLVRFKGLILPVACILIWGVLARILPEGSFIPSPSDVIDATYVWVFGGGDGVAFSGPYSGTWLHHAYASTSRVLIGFAIASILGIGVGLLIGYFRLFEELVDPMIQVFRPIPTVAYVPFSVILFGIGGTSAIFLIALAAFFPIVINTDAGVKSIPPSLLRAARMLGTPKSRIMPLVIFPAALPSIFTGLRVGLGLAWVLVVTSEMLAVKGGLGFVLWDSYAYLRMDLIVSAMFSIGALGFFSDRLLLSIGKMILRWHIEDNA